MFTLTNDKIETINHWLAEAYEAGKLAASPSEAAQPSENQIIYPICGLVADISAYQPDPDYDKLCDGLDFIIMRARVCTKTDKKFEERAAELNKRNFPFAVYDYATLMSHGNAKAQAEAVYNLCEKYHPTVYYIDTEQLGTGVQRGEEMSYIETYVKTLRDLGVQKIGQYTGDWLYSTYYKRIQDLFDTLWIASYGKDTGTDDGVTLASAKYTDKIDLHQFTSKGVIPGISTKGDLSHFTGNKPISWFTGRAYQE